MVRHRCHGGRSDTGRSATTTAPPSYSAAWIMSSVMPLTSVASGLMLTSGPGLIKLSNLWCKGCPLPSMRCTASSTTRSLRDKPVVSVSRTAKVMDDNGASGAGCREASAAGRALRAEYVIARRTVRGVTGRSSSATDLGGVTGAAADVTGAAADSTPARKYAAKLRKARLLLGAQWLSIH